MARWNPVEKINRSNLIKKGDERGMKLYYVLQGVLVGVLFLIILLPEGSAFHLVTHALNEQILAFAIIFIIGFNVVLWIGRKTESLEIWSGETNMTKDENFKLVDDSKTINRAGKGMEFSRGKLKKRIKDLILDKIKVEKDLTDEEVSDIIDDEERLRESVDDDAIVEFLLSFDKKDDGSSKEKGIFKTSLLRDDEDYKKEIASILERIDRWE